MQNIYVQRLQNNKYNIYKKNWNTFTKTNVKVNKEKKKEKQN
jgi:hypothetical protein